MSVGGGHVVEDRIPLCEPRLGRRERALVRECVADGWVSSAGPFVGRFEEAVADYLGRRYAVACVNGTAALHTALRAAGVGTGDAVIVPALTFAATANAVCHAGAVPIFMDVTPDLWQLDVEKTAEFLRRECVRRRGGVVHRADGRRIKAVIPVHLMGHPVDMDPLCGLAERYGVTVIEDAAEALGAMDRGRRVGALGAAACLSFNGNKIITCGGGGMVATDDADLAGRVRHLMTQARRDPIEGVHDEVGYNYRLTGLQAALGLAQMERLEDHVTRKRRIADRYRRGLGGVPGLDLPREAPWARSTFWLFTILVDPVRFGMDSRRLLRRLAAEGIETRPLWRPLPGLAPFRDFPAYRVETAWDLHRRGLSLPSSVGLTAGVQERVIAAVLAAGGRR